MKVLILLRRPRATSDNNTGESVVVRQRTGYFTVPQFLTVSSCVALVVLLIVSMSATMRIRALIREQSDSTKTAEVQFRIEATLDAVKDAETGQRGFLITDNATYLAPYHEALKEIREDRRALNRLFADNAQQLTVLRELGPPLDSKLRELAETIELESHEGFAAAQAVVLSNRGAQDMLTIRRLLNEMLQQEGRLLGQRLSISAASGVDTQRTILLGSLLGALIMGVTATWVTGTIVRPVRRITAAANQIAIGNFNASTPAEGPKELVAMATAINAALDAVTRMNGALQASERRAQLLNDDLEYRVVQRTGDLQTANRDLKAANRELENSNREMDAFTYSVAHDLRTPLRSLYGYSELIRDGHAQQLDEAGQKYFHRIQINTVLMERLIDDLLRLSRTGRVELSPTPMNLSRVAHEILVELSANEPDRIVELHIGADLAAVADERLVRLMLYQLLANSWKFTSARAGARIEIGESPDGESGTFFVRDNGAGFDPLYVDKLFTPFQRLHEHSEFEGNGIGLAIAARVAQRHGGRMWAESVLDKGAVFFFTLAQPHDREIEAISHGPCSHPLGRG